MSSLLGLVSSVSSFAQSSPGLATAAAALFLVFLLVAALTLAACRALAAPPPRGGSAVTLPNGMRITHWQQLETDFLYKEIWGEASAYGKPGDVAFKRGAVIVDAGANIGMFSLYAAARCGGDATIYAFEPIPSTHAVLAANAAAASAGEYAAQFKPAAGARLAIKPFNLGLSDEAGEVVFEHHPNLSIWSTTDADFAQKRLERVAGDLPRATSCVPPAAPPAAGGRCPAAAESAPLPLATPAAARALPRACLPSPPSPPAQPQQHLAGAPAAHRVRLLGGELLPGQGGHDGED
jgi:FkbM family methyltransferase